MICWVDLYSKPAGEDEHHVSSRRLALHKHECVGFSP